VSDRNPLEPRITVGELRQVGRYRVIEAADRPPSMAIPTIVETNALATE